MSRAKATRKRIGRTHDKEEHGEHGEAHELDRLPAPAVDEDERGPVAGDQPRHREDDVAEAGVVQVLIHCSAGSEALLG